MSTENSSGPLKNTAKTGLKYNHVLEVAVVHKPAHMLRNTLANLRKEFKEESLVARITLIQPCLQAGCPCACSQPD
jgi:hypothetical protein